MSLTEKAIANFKLSRQKIGKKKGWWLVIIDRCPICGRKGVIRLKRRSSTRIRFDIEHWILYSDQRDAIPSMRQRNDYCRVDPEDELFEVLLKEYSKFRNVRVKR